MKKIRKKNLSEKLQKYNVLEYKVRFAIKCNTKCQWITKRISSKNRKIQGDIPYTYIKTEKQQSHS